MIILFDRFDVVDLISMIVVVVFRFFDGKHDHAFAFATVLVHVFDSFDGGTEFHVTVAFVIQNQKPIVGHVLLLSLLFFRVAIVVAATKKKVCVWPTVGVDVGVDVGVALGVRFQVLSGRGFDLRYVVWYVCGRRGEEEGGRKTTYRTNHISQHTEHTAFHTNW